MSDTLVLKYGTLVVGRVSNTLFSDNTWYGLFQSDLGQNPGALGLRVAEYIAFCEDWNKRTEERPDSPPDASEFDRFDDIIKSDNWTATRAEGENLRILNAPVFFPGGEISWRPA
jgi:hypothetical protein